MLSYILVNICMLMQGHSTWLMHDQSHNIEVLQGAIFMKQNMKFGLILGRLAILKKNGPIMSNF